MCNRLGDSLGLPSNTVALKPYDPAWVDTFETEQEALDVALGALVLDIQHVGSTSIPGMPAKPILDIGIAVLDFEEAKACIQPLERLGYTYRGEFGIPKRHYFVKGEPCTHHLHMQEVTSIGWVNLILFRDYLIQHPEMAEAYKELKFDLASRHPDDREAYLDAKGPFIQRVLELARQQASSSGG